MRVISVISRNSCPNVIRLKNPTLSVEFPKTIIVAFRDDDAGDDSDGYSSSFGYGHGEGDCSQLFLSVIVLICPMTLVSSASVSVCTD